MKTQQKAPKKVVTISLTQEAYDRLFEMASQRGQGDLISRLLVEDYARRRNNPTPSDVAFVLRELADKLDKV